MIQKYSSWVCNSGSSVLPLYKVWEAQKHQKNCWEMIPSMPTFYYRFGWKYKGFSKFIKGNFFEAFFKIFSFKQLFSPNRINVCDYWGPDGRLDTKISKIDLCHISMSYASFVIIWHFMSYNAYDIEIWHKSNLSILVSKRPSGLQQSHMFIRFWLNNC